MSVTIVLCPRQEQLLPRTEIFSFICFGFMEAAAIQVTHTNVFNGLLRIISDHYVTRIAQRACNTHICIS